MYNRFDFFLFFSILLIEEILIQIGNSMYVKIQHEIEFWNSSEIQYEIHYFL